MGFTAEELMGGGGSTPVPSQGYTAQELGVDAPFEQPDSQVRPGQPRESQLLSQINIPVAAPQGPITTVDDQPEGYVAPGTFKPMLEPGVRSSIAHGLAAAGTDLIRGTPIGQLDSVDKYFRGSQERINQSFPVPEGVVGETLDALARMSPLIPASLVPFLGPAVGLFTGAGSARAQAEQEGWSPEKEGNVALTRGATLGAMAAVPGLPGLKIASPLARVLTNLALKTLEIKGVGLLGGQAENQVNKWLGEQGEPAGQVLAKGLASKSDWAVSALMSIVGVGTHEMQGGGRQKPKEDLLSKPSEKGVEPVQPTKPAEAKPVVPGPDPAEDMGAFYQDVVLRAKAARAAGMTRKNGGFTLDDLMGIAPAPAKGKATAVNPADLGLVQKAEPSKAGVLPAGLKAGEVVKFNGEDHNVVADTPNGVLLLKPGGKVIVLAPTEKSAVALQVVVEKPAVETNVPTPPRQQDDMGFYSKLVETAQAKLPNRGSATQMLQTLLAGGIKKEELQHYGVAEFLGAHDGPVSKENLLQHLEENHPGLKEEVYYNGERRWGDESLNLSGANKNSRGELGREILLTVPEGKTGSYAHAHFPETPNVVAHARVSDHMGKDGKKVLVVNEIQSDAHREGGKYGYRTGEEVDKLNAIKERRATAQSIQDAVNQKPRESLTVEEKAAYVAASKEFRDATKEYDIELGRQHGKVPDLPFKNTWHELITKRILRIAAEEGYDRVAWTTGRHQIVRSSKDVQKISWEHGQREGGIPTLNSEHVLVTPHHEGYADKGFEVNRTTGKVVGDELGGRLVGKTLKELVGADVADQIIKQSKGELTGDNLSVGGEWMKNLYDKMFAINMKKHTKKWGGEVGQTEVHGGKEDTFHTLHSLDITPDIRKGVMEGQERFSPARTPHDGFNNAIADLYAKDGKDISGEVRTPEVIAKDLQESEHVKLSVRDMNQVLDRVDMRWGSGSHIITGRELLSMEKTASNYWPVKLAHAMGYEVALVQPGGKKHGPSGTIVTLEDSPGSRYLRRSVLLVEAAHLANPKDMGVWLVMHEAFHALRESNERGYRKLVNLVRQDPQLVGALETAKQKYIDSSSPERRAVLERHLDLKTEEGFATAFENLAQTKEFYDLLEKKSPGLLKNIGDAVMSVIKKFTKLFGGQDTPPKMAELFADFVKETQALMGNRVKWMEDVKQAALTGDDTKLHTLTQHMPESLNQRSFGDQVASEGVYKDAPSTTEKVIQSPTDAERLAKKSEGWNVLRMPYRSLTDRLASVSPKAGSVTDHVVHLFRRVEDIGKQGMREDSKVYDDAIRVMSRPTAQATAGHDIQMVPGSKSFVSNTRVLLEQHKFSDLFSIPGKLAGVAKTLVDANNAIDLRAEGAIKDHVAQGDMQKLATFTLMDAFKSGGGRVFENYADGVLKLNEGVTRGEVLAYMDEVGQTINSGQFEKAYSMIAKPPFERVPSGFYINRGLLNQAVWFYHDSPVDYLKTAKERVLNRAAFKQVFGSANLADLQRKIDNESIGGGKYFSDIVRSLHGLPIHPGLDPTSVAGTANRWFQAGVQNIATAASTVGAVPSNLMEVVSGNNMAVFGPKWVAKGAAYLVANGKQGLENVGAIDRLIHDFSLDPTSKIRTILRLTRTSLASFNGIANELGETSAAATMKVMTDAAQHDGLSGRERGRLENFAKLSGFEPGLAKLMGDGKASQEQYDQLIRKASSTLTGGNIRGTEKSMFEGSRAFQQWFPFMSYPAMQMRIMDSAASEAFRAVRSGKNYGPAVETFMRVWGGVAVRGALTGLVAAMLTGGKTGLQIALQEGEEDVLHHPINFLLGLYLKGIGGPLAMMNRIGQTGRPTDLANISYRAGLIQEMYSAAEAVVGQSGPNSTYKDMSAIQVSAKFAQNRFPTLNIGQTWMSIMGLGSKNVELDQSIKGFYRWKRDNNVASFGASGGEEDSILFRNTMRQASEMIKRHEDPTQYILDSLKTSNKLDLAGSLQGRRLLSGLPRDLPQDKLDSLKRRLGQKQYDLLIDYDDTLSAWAGVYNIPSRLAGRGQVEMAKGFVKSPTAEELDTQKSIAGVKRHVKGIRDEVQRGMLSGVAPASESSGAGGEQADDAR